MNKRMTLEEMVGAIRPGSMVAFGGSGLQRKPMAAAKAMARMLPETVDLAVMLGGPEVDLLIGAGKVRKLHFAYVGFDRFGMAPNFRKAREKGEIHAVEYSEGTILSAFDAAAQLLPFMPSRRAQGTALLTMENSPFRLFDCPISGETLVAVPALAPDVLFLHVNEADASGYGVILGDPFIDPLLARAAKRVFLTCDRLVDSVPQPASRAALVSRMWVDGVCEVPRGAAPTGMFPSYTPDARTIVEYQERATDKEWLSSFITEKGR